MPQLPVNAQQAVTAATFTVSGAFDSAGTALALTTPTEQVEIINDRSAQWPIEFQVGSGAWRQVQENKAVLVPVDLSTTTLRFRRTINSPNIVVDLNLYAKPSGLAAGNSQQVDIFSASEQSALKSLASGAGVDVSFTRDFDGASLGYTLDAGSGQVLPVMRVTVEAATTVIAGARISSGGINTFETTITGASAQGDVIPISVGAARITRVHVGLSTGTAQTLSGDATVTTNELASWSCLETDDCNAIFVRFSQPRSSGRLCDVTIVGKARA